MEVVWFDHNNDYNKYQNSILINFLLDRLWAVEKHIKETIYFVEVEMNEENEVDEGRDGSPEAETENNEAPGSDAGRPPRMFTFHTVNSYGNADVDTIRDDGKPIKFHNR